MRAFATLSENESCKDLAAVKDNREILPKIPCPYSSLAQIIKHEPHFKCIETPRSGIAQFLSPEAPNVQRPLQEIREIQKPERLVCAELSALTFLSVSVLQKPHVKEDPKP